MESPQDDLRLKLLWDILREAEQDQAEVLHPEGTASNQGGKAMEPEPRRIEATIVLKGIEQREITSVVEAAIREEVAAKLNLSASAIQLPSGRCVQTLEPSSSFKTCHDMVIVQWQQRGFESGFRRMRHQRQLMDTQG